MLPLYPREMDTSTESSASGSNSATPASNEVSLSVDAADDLNLPVTLGILRDEMQRVLGGESFFIQSQTEDIKEIAENVKVALFEALTRSNENANEELRQAIQERIDGYTATFKLKLVRLCSEHLPELADRLYRDICEEFRGGIEEYTKGAKLAVEENTRTLTQVVSQNSHLRDEVNRLGSLAARIDQQVAGINTNIQLMAAANMQRQEGLAWHGVEQQLRNLSEQFNSISSRLSVVEHAASASEKN